MNDGTELVEAYDYLLKCIIVGEMGTGKSCLIHQFIHESFKEQSPHTIGVEFHARTLRIGDKTLKLQVWDTAGQERFRSVTRSYYRGAAAVILVYDITQRSTFQHLDRWLADCRALASPHVAVVLVGNKADREAEREVEYGEGLRWAEEHNLLFLETSCVTGTNAPQPFLLAAQSILVLLESGELDPDVPGAGVSYGERKLRAVGSSSRLSFASGMSLGSVRLGRRRRAESVHLRDVVGRGGKCC